MFSVSQNKIPSFKNLSCFPNVKNSLHVKQRFTFLYQRMTQGGGGIKKSKLSLYVYFPIKHFSVVISAGHEKQITLG